MIGKTEVARLADWAVGAGLDLLLLDGDFADGRPDLVGDIIEPLAQLGSAGTAAQDGVWFVTGNHEYLHGGSGPAWMEWWSTRGVKVLYNNHTSLPGDAVAKARGCGTDEQFHLAGVPDFWMDTPKLGEALEGVEMGEPVVLLAHQPNQAVEASALAGRVQLQISGQCVAAPPPPPPTSTTTTIDL